MRKILVFALLIGVLTIPASYCAGAEWKAENCLLTPRDQFTGGVIDGKIYVFGGNGCPYSTDLKSLEMFDPANQRWSFRPENTHNDGLGAEELTGCVFNNKLYVFGGANQAEDNDSIPYAIINFSEEYDPFTDTWTSIAPMPTKKTKSTAIVYNGEIYLFGGEDANGVKHGSVEAYNPATNTWRYVTTIPGAEIKSAVAVTGDKAYVFGGFETIEEETRVDDVIAYDFQLDEWFLGGFEPLKEPMSFTYSSAPPVIDGKVYLIGGRNGSGEYSDSIMIYNTITDSWAFGPSLPQTINDHLVVLRHWFS